MTVARNTSLLEACRLKLKQQKQESVPSDKNAVPQRKESNSEGTPVEQNVSVSRVLEFWPHMEMWLRAACHPCRQGESFSLLHALAQVGGCPTEVAQLAVALYPEQALTRDGNGNLPLHLLCSCKPANNFDCQSLLEALLTCSMESARHTNRNGRLPLNIALASGKGGNFAQLLIDANPWVPIGMRDTETGLPSFALAAAAPTLETHAYAYNTSNVGSLWHFLPPHAQQERLEQARRQLNVTQLDTIYRILRAAPHAVQYGLY